MSSEAQSLAQVWQLLEGRDGDEWSLEDKIDYLNNFSQELLANGRVGDSVEVDERLGGFMLSLEGQDDHGYTRGQDWHNEVWKGIYDRADWRKGISHDSDSGAEVEAESPIQSDYDVEDSPSIQDQYSDHTGYEPGSDAEASAEASDSDRMEADPYGPLSQSSAMCGQHVNDTPARQDSPIQSSEPADQPVPVALSEGRPLQSGNTTSDKADWWMQQLSRTHTLIAGKDSQFLTKPPSKIKIAILDSGLSFNTAKEIKNLSSFRSRITDGASFLTNTTSSTWKEDPAGHGTAVTSLIAATAPHADLYIARVLRFDPTDGICIVDKDAVAAALTHAATIWKVDVLNMSFGWTYDDHDGVSSALELCARNHVLLFAATSNYGLGPVNHILWPGRSPHVICVDAADGKGAEWEDNPKVRDLGGKLRFTALGVDVACHYPLDLQPAGTRSGTQVRQTGTSFACAVATGVAALVLEFARQPPCSWVPELQARLVRRPDVMQKVFLGMSDSKTVEEFHFLYPWTLVAASETGGDKFGGEATPGSARWDAAYEIAKLVDKEFGSQLKARFWPEYERRRQEQQTGPG